MAFIFFLWDDNLHEVPTWGRDYLKCLKADALQLSDSVILGGLKSFHLFLRSCIEDLLRYVFYFHHEIEHELLQTDPTTYKSMRELFEWVKTHPNFKKLPGVQIRSASQVLRSEHSELSRTVHTTTLGKLQLVEGIESIHKPLANMGGEVNRVKRISNASVFLLSGFHLETYRKLPPAKRACINAVLNTEQVRSLSGLK